MQVDEWLVTLADGRAVRITFGGGHWSLIPVIGEPTWSHDDFHGATDVEFESGLPMSFTPVLEDEDGEQDRVTLAQVAGVTDVL